MAIIYFLGGHVKGEEVNAVCATFGTIFSHSLFRSLLIMCARIKETTRPVKRKLSCNLRKCQQTSYIPKKKKSTFELQKTFKGIFVSYIIERCLQIVRELISARGCRFKLHFHAFSDHHLRACVWVQANYLHARVFSLESSEPERKGVVGSQRRLFNRDGDISRKAGI